MAKIMLGKSFLLGDRVIMILVAWAFEGKGSYMDGHNKEIQSGKKYIVKR